MLKTRIGIIGLGYVGLPLAIEFGKKILTVGYDKSLKRIKSINKQIDYNNEITKKNFLSSKYFSSYYEIDKLKNCNFYIIAVPTPVTISAKPNLSGLILACKNVAKILKKRDIVVFESTVYPGTTEKICIPIIEKISGLKLNKDFDVGYSPERINPGDKINTVTNICKLVAANNTRAAKKIGKIYKMIIKNIFITSSIMIAESAKIIENVQRDVNISLMNELTIIFNKLKIDTKEVLKAAGTKWNFLKFTPGLVGGHCIGVDPYYLSFLARKIGYKDKIILAGRKLNDSMASYFAKRFINKFKNNKSNILLLGLTFKENCKDLRNSQVFKMIRILEKKYNVSISDPLICREDLKEKYRNKFIEYDKINFHKFKAVIIIVGHNQIKKLNIKKMKYFLYIYDLKGLFSKENVNLQF